MFDVSSKTVAIATIAVLIGIMLYSGLTYQSKFENSNITFKETPLAKNKELQLMAGEEYRYSYLLNNTEINVTYAVMSGDGCTVIRLMESVTPSWVCIDEWGVDESGSNSTFLNPAILPFRPWMLALHETWRWNNSMYMSFDDTAQHISDNHYKVIRTENYRGRMSYVVRIKSSDGPAEYQWIDMEKRVLLRILGEGYEVVLVEGLPLDLSDNN